MRLVCKEALDANGGKRNNIVLGQSRSSLINVYTSTRTSFPCSLFIQILYNVVCIIVTSIIPDIFIYIHKHSDMQSFPSNYHSIVIVV